MNMYKQQIDRQLFLSLRLITDWFEWHSFSSKFRNIESSRFAIVEVWLIQDYEIRCF